MLFFIAIGIIVANVPEGLLPKVSSLSLGFFSNKLILHGIVSELSVILLIIYTPVGNALFGTTCPSKYGSLPYPSVSGCS